MQPKGIIEQASPWSVRETIDRIAGFLKDQGATIYARIDQQSEVHKSGREIPPLEFLLFGNPKAGGPIMEENPMAALELPLKIIAWQDKEGKTWIAYNEAQYIEDRYSLRHELMLPLDLHPVITRAMA
jgi:uncharacterized protein (DUF302 family)